MLFVLFQHIGITYHSYKIDSNFERKINYNYFGRSKEGTKTKLFKIFKKKKEKRGRGQISNTWQAAEI